MKIKDILQNEASFIPVLRKEVVVTIGGKTVTLFAEALSLFASHNIAIQAQAKNQNSLALLVAESICDADGGRFTYDDVMKLNREISETLLTAALEVNKGPDPEKK